MVVFKNKEFGSTLEYSMSTNVFVQIFLCDFHTKSCFYNLISMTDFLKLFLFFFLINIICMVALIVKKHKY